MVKVPEMPIRQEKALSSEFHMQMLRELEAHHDEKSIDWGEADPQIMLQEAASRIAKARGSLKYAPSEFELRQLVHAANYLTIAWAILSTKTQPIPLVKDQERAGFVE
jgi:hypothetical protein